MPELDPGIQAAGGSRSSGAAWMAGTSLAMTERGVPAGAKLAMKNPLNRKPSEQIMSAASWSIVVPTYRREQVLVETIDALLDLSAREILVVDQSPTHELEVANALRAFTRDGCIQLVRPPSPNIPAAMNLALNLAHGDFVLFVDDDVRPSSDLLEAHGRAQATTRAGLVAGRVIQPWDCGGRQAAVAGDVGGFCGCNFSVDRNAALSLGGFDENFAGAAYGYEVEFAFRWRRSGRRIFYEPDAALQHLKFPSGGTRARGDHLHTMSPDHAVGAYYCLLRTWQGWSSARAFAGRPFKAVATRHHLRRPWWIPATLIGEATGAAWAGALALRGPKLSPSC